MGSGRSKTNLLAVSAVFAVSAAGSARADSRIGLVAWSGAAAPEVRAQFDAATHELAVALPHHRVVGTAQSRATVQRVAGCAHFDDECLERYAQRQQVDRILYGWIGTGPSDTIEAATSPEPSSAGASAATGDAAAPPAAAPDGTDEPRVVVRIGLFDAYTRQTRHVVDGYLDVNDAAHARAITRLLEKLVPLAAELPEEGALLVRAVEGARIELDGRVVGVIPESAELLLEPLRAGRHVLVLTRPNGSRWEAPVVVRTRASVTVSANLDAATAGLDGNEGGRPRRARPTVTAPEWARDASEVAAEAATAATETTDAAIPLEYELELDVSRGFFHIPLLEEHVQRGEIRATAAARVGFLPNVTSSGARVTAKLRF